MARRLFDDVSPLLLRASLLLAICRRNVLSQLRCGCQLNSLLCCLIRWTAGFPHTHVRTRTHTHTHTHTRAHTHTPHIHTHAHTTYTHTRAHTRTHTHTRAHTHTPHTPHTHTRTRARTRTHHTHTHTVLYFAPGHRTDLPFFGGVVERKKRAME